MEIKRARIEDYDCFYNMRSEDQNLFWTGYSEKPNYENFKEWYKKRLLDNSRLIYLLWNDDKHCVGYLNFDKYPTHIAIGYGVSKAEQGRGYATSLVKAAVELGQVELGVNPQNTKLIAWISEENKASQKVVLKNGFIQSTTSETRKRHGNEEQYWRFDFAL